MDDLRNIGKSELTSVWLPIHNRVFRDSRYPENIFRNVEWPRIILPFGLDLMEIGDEVFIALTKMVRSTGDELVLSYVYEIEDGDMAVLCGWNDIPKELSTGFISHFHFHTFSKLGTWGIDTDFEDFCVVGATPELLTVLVEALGGTEAVKARFREYVKEFGDAKEYNFGRSGAYLRNVLTSIGWEWDSSWSCLF